MQPSEALKAARSVSGSLRGPKKLACQACVHRSCRAGPGCDCYRRVKLGREVDALAAVRATDLSTEHLHTTNAD